MGIKKLIRKIKGEKKVIEGKATKDKIYSSEMEFPTLEDAEREFKRSVDKIFKVDQWSEMPGITSKFKLYNSLGREKGPEKPELHDYIKINLPGAVPENWVIVTDIKENEKSAEFTVSPSTNPTKKEEDQDKIAHFFIAEATSTFRVQLNGKSICAYEIGKNEGINNDEENAGKRKLINTLIAEGGWAGIQKYQWEKLTDYLVHKKEIE